MVTKNDVISCYKYILGREPEDERAIENHLVAFGHDINALRHCFFQSKEFLGKIRGTVDLYELLPPHIPTHNEIDCEASSTDLEKMFQRIKEEWEEFGKTEPHWSVLTGEEFKQERLEQNIGHFFDSGRQMKELIESFLHRHNIDLGQSPVFFELGCGVGRITMHLAQMCKKIIGADISKFHLAICQKELEQRNINNAELMALNSPKDLEKLESFDLFYSFIVLQHNPPPAMTYFLDTILQKLSSGGVAIFQVPVWHDGYSFRLEDYLAKKDGMGMEMHVLPQSQLFKIIQRNQCRVVELREDNMVSMTPEWRSNTFYIIKE